MRSRKESNIVNSVNKQFAVLDYPYYPGIPFSLTFVPDKNVSIWAISDSATLSLKEEVERLRKSPQDRTLGSAHG
jgi:hypothetical protein